VAGRALEQNPARKGRCAVYARISPKAEGAVGDNYSLDSQVDACRNYAAQRSYSGMQVFKDRLVSGGTLERPALEQLRELIRLKLIDVVVCYSPDRWSRDTVDSLLLLKECQRAGVRLEFVSGNYEDTPEGELMFAFQSMVSSYERKKFRERSDRGRKQKAREGFVHSSAPYGYRYLGHREKQRGVLEVIPQQAKVVVMIFEWSALGWTSYRVAMRLNELGIPTAKGHKWFRGSVTQVLKKTAYYGEVAGPDGIIIKVPAILDRALWDKVHARLVQNRVALRGQPSRRYLLRGWLWCSICGKRCTTYPLKRRRALYRCGNVDGTTHRRVCHASGIDHVRLETAVWNDVWETITDGDLLWRMITAYRDRETQPKPKKKNLAIIRIEQLERRIQRAVTILKDPASPIPYDEARKDLERLRTELAEAQLARPAAVIELPLRSDVKAIAAEFRRGQHEIESFDIKRKVLEAVIDKIRYANGQAEIACKIAVHSKKNCNRDLGADAQGEGEQGDRGEAGRFAQHANAVA
jgi:site-specific DNA recombinase